MAAQPEADQAAEAFLFEKRQLRERFSIKENPSDIHTSFHPYFVIITCESLYLFRMTADKCLSLPVILNPVKQKHALFLDSEQKVLHSSTNL